MTTISNILHFPAVRSAFQSTTQQLDNLIETAHKEQKPEVAEAYRKSFELVREGLLRAENQGESNIHKHLDNDVDDLVATITNEKFEEIQRFIGDQYTEALNAFRSEIIQLLLSKNVSESYITTVEKDLDKFTEQLILDVFQEEGYNPDE